MKTMFARSLVLIPLALGACLGTEPATEEVDDIEFDAVEQEAGTFPTVTSFSARGPFATQSTNTGTCTIIRPTQLGQNGVTHPVILWGNGTGASVSTYNAFLSHLASHGFVVAAANTSNAGNGSQMINCLNLVANQNTTPGSTLFQRLDLNQVGTSGHSQGGAGSIMAGRDARVKATAPIQPFISFIPGGGTFSNASISQQRGPMFLVSGSADSIAVPNTQQLPVFNGTNVRVVWGTRTGVNHFEAVGDAGDFRGPVTAFFRNRLMGDTTTGSAFPPGAGWTVRTRN